VIEFARKQNFNAKSRLEMDIEGIDTWPCCSPPPVCTYDHAGHGPAACRSDLPGYNDWLHDFARSQASFGAALLPPHDVSLAMREAGRASSVSLPRSARHAVAGADWSRLLGALWAELEETGMTVGFPNAHQLGTPAPRTVRHR
jgi:hypothetical protein